MYLDSKIKKFTKGKVEQFDFYIDFFYYTCVLIVVPNSVCIIRLTYQSIKTIEYTCIVYTCIHLTDPTESCIVENL